jgi:energy-coupling factor transport system substrate-specific component
MMEGRVDTLRPRLTLYDLVLVATLAVVFGFLYWALVQVWGPLRLAMGPLGDLAQNLLIGGWFVVAPLAIYIVRKPLVGVTTEILASIVEVVFLGSPVGPILLLTGLLQGAGSELPFAITRYRRFEWGVFAVSGLSAAVFSFVYNVFRLGWLGQDYVLLRLGFQLSSGILLGGIVAKVIGDALLRTGVLDNYAIGRAAQS